MIAHTRTTVLNGSVRAREFGEVVSCHLGLDLDGVEHLITRKVSARSKVNI